MRQVPAEDTRGGRVFTRELKPWLEKGRRGLRIFISQYRDWRFWVIQAVVVGLAAFHRVAESEVHVYHMEMLYLVPLSLLLVPVIYAAVVFGLVGAIQTALWGALITVPNVIFEHSGFERLGEIFQMSFMLAVAVFVGQKVDKETRMRRRAQLFGAKVVRAQEEERQRVARELHDDTIQTLALICRRLDTVESASDSLPSPVVDELREVRKTAEGVVKGLRDVARALRPPILEDLGMVPPIRRLVADFSERSGVKAQLKMIGAERRLPPDTELGMFRIAQEALRNVERHSGASEVVVVVTFAEHEARLDLADNGTGFNVPAVRSGLSAGGQLGLLGMQERAELLGGKFQVRSSPGKGTTITVSVPSS